MMPRILLLSLGLTAGFVVPAMAQGPTPAGTVISNTATVSYTDANGNTYGDVTASVDVTVGYQAGVSVTGGEADTPEPGTTGNTLDFTIDNVGNGTDQYQVTVANTDAGVIDVTGYRYNGTTHATLSALNTVLAGEDVALGGSLTVTIVYDVPAGTGGQSATYTLTATSVADAGESDSGSSTVSPAETFDVAVTPDGLGANVEQLPSNGTSYTYTFTVANNGSGEETFDLSAPDNAVLTIDGFEVDGVGATTVTIGASASKDVVVSYTVLDGTAGAAANVTLTATAQDDPTTTDSGFITVERVKAALSIAKRALDGARTGDITEILPDEFIEYEITVTNDGSSSAESVVVEDELENDYLTYVSAENTGGAWTSITTAVNGDGNTVVTATLASPLAPSASATFYIRVQVK